MKAEEARDLSFKYQNGDISRIIQGIKDRCGQGEFDITFSGLTNVQIKKILELGYEVDSFDNIHIIKW